MQSDTTCTGQAILYYAIVTMSMLNYDTITHTQLTTVRLHVLTKTIWSPVRASQDLKRGNAAWPRHHWPIVSHTIQCSSNRNNA